MRAVAVLGVLMCAACSSSAPKFGFAVALTMRFDDSVSGTALGEVADIAIDVSQENYTDTIPLGRAADRTERVVYRPTPGDFLLTFDVTATTASGVAIATGKTTVALQANVTTSAELTLSAATSTDGGADDDAAVDGGEDQVALSFVTAPLVATAHMPVGVGIADFDGDGRNDVAIAASSGAVQIFLAETDHRLPASPNFTSTAASAPGALAVGDFGGDASPDLVVADDFNNLLVFLINDGHGKFTASANPPATPMAPDSIAVADFDHDGKLDVAVGSSTHVGIDVYLSTASPAYSSPQAVSTTTPVIHVRAADFNKDGYFDLIYAFTVGSALGYHINSAGNLAGTEQTISFGAPYDVMTYDLLNNDGYPELLIVGASTGGANPTNALVVDNTAGTFSTPNQPFSLAVGAVQYAQLLDFEGTGKPDFITSEQDLVRLGRPSAIVPFVASTELYVAGASPRSFATGDLDGDGLTDIAFVNAGSDSVSLMYQVSGGALAAAPSIPSYGLLVSLGDWNGDGVTDVMETNGTNVYLFTNDGVGNPNANLQILTIAAGGVAAADMNEDSIPDLVIGSENGELGVALAMSAGSFDTPTYSASIVTKFSGVLAQDVDGDHHIDAVLLSDVTTGNGLGKNVVFARGDGHGATLGTPATFSATGAIAIATADLDEDGHLDVLALSATPPGITWLRGQAGGTLVAGTPINSPVVSATSFAPCDANGDGHVDLLIGGNTLHVLIGDGHGHFTDGGVLFSASPTVGLATGDADGDGVPEIFAATTDSVVRAFRVKEGALAPAGVFSGGGFLTSLVGADLTGDHLVDLVAIGHQIAFMKNDTK